jgi:4-diphosphocytidyl-2-C-methyl-D-erythritol kinase
MIRVFAPAKINLTLKVGRPRADKRHPLCSVVAFADVGDWIEAAPADDFSLTITGPFADELAQESDNLVLRAASALAARAGGQGAALTLTKNLPIASGIGGGSSDAAATLKALNALWALGLSEADLVEIARPLGADVPVCVAARPALMRGAGEIFEPFAHPPLSAVLVNPGTPLPTANVYRAFDAMDLGGDFSDSAPPPWTSPADAIAAMRALGNDLFEPASELKPELLKVQSALRADRRVLHVGLSGSGATFFAIIADRARAESLAADLAALHADWWARATLLDAGAPRA